MTVEKLIARGVGADSDMFLSDQKKYISFE